MLFVQHLASLGSGLLSGAWSVAEHSRDVWGWAGPHMMWLLLPEPPLRRALSIHSLRSHKVIFLSLGKFLFPPRRLVSP